MSDDTRLQIKRAILSELNKELSRKSKTLASATPSTKQPNILPSAGPAKLHIPKPVSSKFDAQNFVGNVPSTVKPKKRVQSKGNILVSRKKVRIPQPTPRLEYPAELQTNQSVRRCVEKWKTQTFGHCHGFSKAGLYHRTRVLQTCLAKWKSETYSMQTEWKLVVRANCHYRFYLKERYWDYWRLYICENRSMVKKKQCADQFCIGMLQRRYLNLLRSAVVIRKDINANKLMAESVYQRSLTQKMVNQWHRAMADRVILHEQENIALHFWALSLQRQCLEQWVVFKNEQLVKQKMNVVVYNFYQVKLMQQSFRSWITYRQQRKCKDILRMRAGKRLKSKLQHKYFYLWNELAYISAKTKNLEGQMQGIQNRTRSRRILLHWRIYCESRSNARELMKKAEIHARRKLLQRVLTSLQLYNEHQKQTLIKKRTADFVRRKHLLSTFFGKWVRKFDESEEDKLKYRTLMARKHYQLKLLSMAVEKWAAYREYRLDHQECYAIADSHYSTNVAQHALTRWHLYLCYRKTVKVKKDTASLHYTELLNHKYFYTWVKMFHVSRNQRLDERIAVLQYNKVVLTKYFEKWRDLSKEQLADRTRSEQALHHFKSRLMKWGIQAFKSNLEKNYTKMVLNARAEEHFCNRQIKQCIVAWAEYSKSRHILKEKYKVADEHYKKKLLSTHLDNWITHHNVFCKARRTVLNLTTQHNKHLLFKVLRRWVSQVKVQQLATDLNLRADLHYKEMLSMKVLSGWLIYTEASARDHVRKMELLEEGLFVLQRLKQRQALTLWRKCTAVKQADRMQCTTADSHYQNKLMHQALVKLKENVQLKFKTIILKGKLNNFVLEHTIRKSFSQWKETYSEKILENWMTEKALWFWCVSLEHRVFRAWLSYSQYRKERHRTYRLALQDRNHYLIQTGLRQWVRSVTAAEESRARAALLAVTRQTYRANELALKWGRHWRSLVKRRARHPPHNTSQNKENTVSSNKILAFVETPKFYDGFKALKSNRPAPKIPAFVDRQYYS